VNAEVKSRRRGGRPLKLIVCGCDDEARAAFVRRLLELGDRAARASSRLEPKEEAAVEHAFIVVDCPGDLRTMANLAADVDVAILLVDARQGVGPETRWQAAAASLLGVTHVVPVVDNMDRVGFDCDLFKKIVADFRRFGAIKGFDAKRAVPMSSRQGDNISSPSAKMEWREGPPLVALLQGIAAGGSAERPMRLLVQESSHSDSGHILAGTLLSGRLQSGDEVMVAASGVRARVIGGGAEREAAGESDYVSIVLDGDLGASRGDVLCRPLERPPVVDQFAATLIWMSDDALLPGRSYLLEANARYSEAVVTEIKHRLDVETQMKLAAKTLKPNEAGFCNLALSRQIAIDAFESNPRTGSFHLLDRASGARVAWGMIAFPLRRATNLFRQRLSIGKIERGALKGQKPAILWFTGLSGAGKSTIANLVEEKLFERRAHTALLDGDNIRSGINRDLGFTEADRVENIRRVAEVAKLMVDAGLIVLCALISPFAADRRFVRELVEEDEFIEIFVDAPLEACIVRDPKGLYKRALAGEIANFTGVNQPYERPQSPELRFETVSQSAEEASDLILDYLVEKSFIRA